MSIDIRFDIRREDFSLAVDFSVPARGVTALFGPSGCGKTTLLRAIAGLEKSRGGTLVVQGVPWQDDERFLPPHKRPLGYVFQEASLFAHLDIRRNLEYGLRRLGAQAPRVSFGQAVDFLGIGHLLARRPHQLSGGERQRVAIGRALLSSPQVLLMDEPLAALDRLAKNEIMPCLERLYDELSIPVLYVSHDMTEIERLADFMVLMETTSGAEGTPRPTGARTSGAEGAPRPTGGRRTGRVRAIGPLEDLLFDPALPLSRMPDAASVLAGELVALDKTYGLATFRVGGAEFLVP